MPDERLELIVVVPSDTLWAEAVSLKRARAFAEVQTQTGLSLAEIQQLYESQKSDSGLAFHDFMLRRDVGDGTLLCWLADGKLCAYANLCVSPYCGSPVTSGIVPDVCFVPGLSGSLRRQVFEELFRMAAQSGVHLLQVTVDGSEADILHVLGGVLAKASFQWRLE